MAGWKDERTDIEPQLAEEEQPAESDADLDPDVVIEELHYLEEHLASNESLLARAAFRRVFKTVTLYWNHDGGRELDRAEVEPQHPFALTENTRIRVPSGTKRERNVIRHGTIFYVDPLAVFRLAKRTLTETPRARRADHLCVSAPR